MFKDKEKQKAANRAAKERWKAKQGIPAGIPKAKGILGIPNIKPLGIPTERTSSTCNSFETLPIDVQEQINRLSPIEGEGTGPPGVIKADRIANAIHYQQYVRAG